MGNNIQNTKQKVMDLNNFQTAAKKPLAANDTSKKPEERFPTAVIVYGVIAEVCVLVPIILYLTAGTRTVGHNKFHSTMINMLASSYAPLAIGFIFVLAEGVTPFTKTALMGAMTMAGMGPFSTQWVGFIHFIMAASSAKQLGTWNNLFFTFFYLAFNIGMIVVHWFFSKDVMNWLKKVEMKGTKKAAAPKKAASSGFVYCALTFLLPVRLN